jgi:hypothetical protein
MLAAIIKAKQAVGASRDEINDWAEKKVRNEIEGGRLLAGVERQPGERNDITSSHDVTRFQQALHDAGLDRMAAQRWQTMAQLPDNALQAYFEERRHDPKNDKVKAEIKGGVLLAGVERQPRKRTDLSNPQSAEQTTPYQEVKKAASLSDDMAERWQIMALVPSASPRRGTKHGKVCLRRPPI